MKNKIPLICSIVSIVLINIIFRRIPEIPIVTFYALIIINAIIFALTEGLKSAIVSGLILSLTNFSTASIIYKYIQRGVISEFELSSPLTVILNSGLHLVISFIITLFIGKYIYKWRPVENSNIELKGTERFSLILGVLVHTILFPFLCIGPRLPESGDGRYAILSIIIFIIGIIVGIIGLFPFKTRPLINYSGLFLTGTTFFIWLLSN